LDGEENAFNVAENFVIPKSKHSVAFLVQMLVSNRIFRRSIVLSAIDLDNKCLLPAYKIANVSGYRFLSHEFMPIDLPIAETIPKKLFRIRLVDPQSSRGSDGLLVRATHCLAPHPE
jgi:hypothetical protein